MLRIIMLPLVLFTLSMACMGQTFQYSRGWTNGKRVSTGTSASANLLTNPTAHFHRSDENYGDFYDLQDNDRKLERCLVQLQRFVGNALLHRAATSPFANTLSFNANKNNNNNNNNNNDNSLYPNHHQSNELLEELNAAMSSGAAVEPNDYGKH